MLKIINNKIKMNELRLITKNELSERLSISTSKINKMIKNKELDYLKIGKSVRFNLNNIEENIKTFIS
jgi:excisionase family DNA binding protein